MAYTLSSKVRIDLRADGKDLSGEYGPGDVDLPRPVAELLIAQGFAVETTASKKAAKPAQVETPTAETPEE